MIHAIRVIEYVYEDEGAMRSDQGKWATDLVTERMTMRTIAVSSRELSDDPGDHLLMTGPYQPPKIGLHEQKRREW
jgi:hypothetical protein